MKGYGSAEDCSVAGWVFSGAVIAQATNHYTEYVKTITTAKNIQAYDKNLFGDQINLYTGSTEFSVR